MKYYRVTVRRGHCGKGRYIPITFAVYAENMLDAIDYARRMPAVKHERMVLSACEIPFSEYVSLRKTSAYVRAGGVNCNVQHR